VTSSPTQSGFSKPVLSLQFYLGNDEPGILAEEFVYLPDEAADSTL